MEVRGGPPGSGVTWSHARTPPSGPADAGALPRLSEEHQWVRATKILRAAGVIIDNGPIRAGAYSG
eukprot:1283036-Prorocentrum_lima.AAC.1